jgi:hypothetical protein
MHDYRSAFAIRRETFRRATIAVRLLPLMAAGVKNEISVALLPRADATARGAFTGHYRAYWLCGPQRLRKENSNFEGLSRAISRRFIQRFVALSFSRDPIRGDPSSRGDGAG